jgi:hypothetical protein
MCSRFRNDFHVPFSILTSHDFIVRSYKLIVFWFLYVLVRIGEEMIQAFFFSKIGDVLELSPGQRHGRRNRNVNYVHLFMHGHNCSFVVRPSPFQVHLTLTSVSSLICVNGRNNAVHSASRASTYVSATVMFTINISIVLCISKLWTACYLNVLVNCL